MTQLNELRSLERESNGKSSRRKFNIILATTGGYKAITSTGFVYCSDKAELIRYLKTL